MKYELIKKGPIPEDFVIESFCYDKYQIRFEKMIYGNIRIRVYLDDIFRMPIDWCCGHSVLLRTVCFCYLLSAIDNDEFHLLPPDTLLKPVDLDVKFISDLIRTLGRYENVVTIQEVHQVLNLENVQTS